MLEALSHESGHPPGNEAISGREEIRRWLQGPFAELTFDYSVDDIRLRIASGWAVENATFETRVTTSDGESMPPHRGNYTLLWRKEPSGAWLIERYIDHSAEFVAVVTPA